MSADEPAGDNPQGQQRPNILMVITHDTGCRLGCYGASVHTPHLDALAASGARFTRYFCAAPQCSPSRGSILTGRFPHQNGLMGLAHLGWRLNTSERCLAHYLNEAGYATYLCGLQHEDGNPRRLGYSQIVETRHDAASVAGAVTGVLEALPRDAAERPFFIMAGTSETHRPFDRAGYVPDDPEAESVPSYLPDVSEVRRELAGFGGLVRAADEAMGRMLTALERTGWARSTMVIFTTDHGIAFPRAKGTGFDPGLETALIVRWPGHVRAGRVIGELLSNVDLLPTILAAVGGAPHEGLSLAGRSFLPLLTERGEFTPRQHIFFEETWHDRYSPFRGVRTTRWKYMRNYDLDNPAVYLPADIYRSSSGAVVRDAYYGKKKPEEELYDLAADPGEAQNLAGQSRVAAELAYLRGLLLGWLEATGDPLLAGPVVPPVVQAERLSKEAAEGHLTGPLSQLERQLIDTALGLAPPGPARA